MLPVFLLCWNLKKFEINLLKNKFIFEIHLLKFKNLFHLNKTLFKIAQIHTVQVKLMTNIAAINCICSYALNRTFGLLSQLFCSIAE